MSYQKLGSILGSVALGLVLLYLAVAVPIPTGATSAIPQSDRSYAERGVHTVGMETVTTRDDSPLTLVMWYPAENSDNVTPSNTYRLQMKMGDPFGAVTVATYAGNAIPNAPYHSPVEPYPLVILSPGFSMGAMSYAWLAEHLASYGFVVVAPEHQEHFDGELNGLWQAPAERPADIIAVLDYVDQQTANGGALANVVDAEQVAVVGHSYGGYTTLAAGGAQIDAEAFRQHCADARAAAHPAAWLCDEIEPHLDEMAIHAGFETMPDSLWELPVDPRIDALVPIAGDAYFFSSAGLGNITAPMLAIGGTADKDTPWEWGPQLAYDNVSSTEKILIGLQGADHMIFTGPCEAIPLALRLMSDEFCATSAWGNRYRAHNVVKHFATAFLLVELAGDTEAANALAPEKVTQPDITYIAQGY
jgi:predicted dienelactone hydrolase